MNIRNIHTAYEFKSGHKVKNRFVLAPMTNSQSLNNGKLSIDEFLWLKQFAQGGFGIVLTCASHISKEAQAWSGQLGIYSDDFIPSLKVLTETIHTYDSLAILQIFHGGGRCPSALTGLQPVSASAYELFIPGFEKPRELLKDEILKIIEDFSDAARRAYLSGFDGIEIHGANGYLITQFISRQTNMRHDEYGGSVQNRGRLLFEIIKNCRKKTSEKFIIGVRLSPENSGDQLGLDLAENIEISKRCIEEVDYIHLSCADAFKKSVLNNVDETIVFHFKKALGSQTPIIISGNLKHPKECENIISLGSDFVSLGKIAIGNPFFPIRSFNENYKPNLPPYTKKYLDQCNVNQGFFSLLGYFEDLVQ